MIDAWTIVRAAARAADELDTAPVPVSDATSFGFSADRRLIRCSAEQAPAPVLVWRDGAGWESLMAADDPRRPLVDLYLPICGATKARPITVGHLGQSLDGFI